MRNIFCSYPFQIRKIFDSPRWVSVASGSISLVIFFFLWDYFSAWYQVQVQTNIFILHFTGYFIGVLIALLVYLLINRQMRMTAGITRRTTDIEHQLAALEKSEKKNAQLAELLRIQHDIDRAILAAESPSEIAQVALEHFRRLFPDFQPNILLFDHQKEIATILASSLDKDTKPLGYLNLPLKEIDAVTQLRKGNCYIKKFDSGYPQSSFDRHLHLRHIQSYISLPLISHQKLIGALTLGKRSQQEFSTQIIETAQEVADSLAVAINQAQLFESESRQRQEAEILRKTLEALTTNLDEDQVLHHILLNLEELIVYDSATVFLLHDTHLCVKAAIGFDAVAEIIDKCFPIDDDTIFHQIYQSHKPLMLFDWDAGLNLKGWGNTKKVKSWMGIPLISRDEIIGCLTIDSYNPKQFSNNDLALAQTFANQAAIALENARLYTQACQRVKELDALTATMTDISAELELPKLLQAILNRSVELLGGAGGDLGIYHQATQTIEIVASLGLGKEYAGTVLQLDEGAMGYVAQTGKAVVVDDYNCWAGRSDQYALGKWNAVISVPLKAGNVFLGAIGVVYTEPNRRFLPSELELLELFAQQAAIAVQNASLFSEVRRLASTDDLTGVLNRRELLAIAQREISRARRFNRPLAVLVFDVDYFKHTNDNYGHIAGDQVLRGVINRCQNNIREIDMLGRYGGDEFVIVLPETALNTARTMAERLRQVIAEKPFQTDAGMVNTTISVGISTLCEYADSIEVLFNNADIALYAAKEAGRNCIYVYSLQLDSWV